MRKAAIKLIESIGKDDPSANFKMGFHAIPSLKQLHMHVISDDFNSEFLKSKKHWNSYTTEFFVSTEDFIKLLEQKGQIEFDKNKYNALLKLPLKHWKTNETFSTIPKLKQYLASLTQEQ